MKALIIAVAVVTSILGTPSVVWGEVIIEETVEAEISRILAEPVTGVFELDLEEGERVFSVIDGYFGEHFDFEAAIRETSEVEDFTFYKLEMARNVPIIPTERDIPLPPGKAVETKEPFNAFYFQEPQGRCFVKELSVPTENSIREEEAIEIGRAFIEDNGLCVITEVDTPSASFAISIIREELGYDIPEPRVETLYEAVIFKRKFMDIEVANSKQVIGIHPDSGEVLTYINTSWTPVDEESRKTPPYKSKDKVLADIKSLLGGSEVNYTVTRVESAMFQNDALMFPVLTVYTEREADDTRAVPTGLTLMIPLVEGLELEPDIEGIELVRETGDEE
jgi:hypothetical protein